MSAGPIVLPRPNLGPEALPESPLWPWIAAVATLVSLAALLLRRHRRRAKARAATAVASETSDPSPSPMPRPDRVRDALIRAFGTPWGARTTEEIAASPALSDRFGPEAASRVVAYLRASDRAKFSGNIDAPDEALILWAARFAEEVKTAPPTGPLQTPGISGSSGR